MSTITFLSISILALILKPTLSKTIDESKTGALLTFPSVIDGPLYGKAYDVAPSQFGYQKYGGTMEGVLILPANETYHKECPKCGHGTKSYCDSIGQEPAGINPYIHYINDWFIADDDIKDYIMVIDRHDCYFVDKVEYAQELGASGVIICDYINEHLFTMWMPSDWTDDIDIPSVLLGYNNCKTLMSHIGVKDWDPTDENFVYPTPEQINWTIATIEWGLPHPDDLVEWQLWTSSNDYLGSKFKHNFNTTAIELDRANDTIFTPHMYILDGSHWYCDLVIAGKPIYPCKKQCTNTGRYCAVDPEYDLTIGLDGMDVIQENLRSLCVWEYDKEMKGIMDDVMWWDYAVLWDENCGVYSNSSLNFHVNCSYAQMDKLITDGTLSTYVKNCVNESGGYEYSGGKNKILQKEMNLKYNSSIYAVPLVRVNEFLIHGNIDCEPDPWTGQITTGNCEVLAAICAGFINGTLPDVCDLTPSPTIANCSDSERDCAGECFGSHLTDACNKCLLVSDHEWNECIGCNGLVNTTYDCEGTCGGHYAVNPCGYCKDTQHPEFYTFGTDCLGNCSMTFMTDECDQCLEETDPEWNSCVGCDNIPYSGKKFNSCGRCIDEDDANFDEYGRDCTGNCSGSAETTHYYDSCGQCLLRTDAKWGQCCDGDTSKRSNPCGFCLPQNLSNFETYGQDCEGTCGGMKQLDECGKCILSSNSTWNDCIDCEGRVNGGKKENDCGFCLDPTLENFDDYGKNCEGDCEAESAERYSLDKCGKCLTTNNSTRDACIGCDGVAYSGMEVNDCGVCANSSASDFDDNGRDCRGECADETEQYDYDECGQCLLSSDSSWNSCLDCKDVPNGGKIFNDCGYCLHPNDDSFDTYGKNCKGICEGESTERYSLDKCGKCLTTESSLRDACVGCDGVANSTKEFNKCGVCISTDDVNFNEHGKDCRGECSSTVSQTYYVDECGKCLLINDDDWNKCLANQTTNGGGSGAASGNSDGSSTADDNSNGNEIGLLMYIIIAFVAFCLIICAFGVIGWQCKRHNDMKKQFAEILSHYDPMGDNEELQESNTKSKGRKKGMTSAPGDDDL